MCIVVKVLEGYLGHVSDGSFLAMSKLGRERRAHEESARK
jgi:hypothetical protein